MARSAREFSTQQIDNLRELTRVHEVAAVGATGCPGLMLLGDVQEAPVTDWSFANDIPLCQIQISAGVIPHAENLNCMATPDGALFLSCSGCADKHWSSQVGPNERGRLRFNGRVYPVVYRASTRRGDPRWLFASTLLTLFIVPALYLRYGRFRAHDGDGNGKMRNLTPDHRRNTP